MPPGTPATVTQPSPPSGQQTGAGAAQAPQVLVPFTRASQHHTEQGWLDQAATPGTASRTDTYDVPAAGYLRSIWLQVEATGGSGTAAVYQADAPWSMIESIVLRDINGAPIVGPITGYQLFLINQLLYRNGLSTVAPASYTAPATDGTFRFGLRVPVQIRDRDALGALPNMNAAANYQLEITRAAKGAVYSTDPTTVPSVRITGIAETWTAPPTANALGQAQATQPPSLGTTQYVSVNRQQIASGTSQTRLVRVGNLIRSLIVIGRTAAGARSDTVLPASPRLSWDTRIIRNETLAYNRSLIEKQAGLTLPTGVMVFPYNFDLDGRLGEELGDQWLQTVQSSRIEIEGTNTAAGTLDLLTVDIAPAGDVFTGGV